MTYGVTKIRAPCAPPSHERLFHISCFSSRCPYAISHNTNRSCARLHLTNDFSAFPAFRPATLMPFPITSTARRTRLHLTNDFSAFPAFRPAALMPFPITSTARRTRLHLTNDFSTFPAFRPATHILFPIRKRTAHAGNPCADPLVNVIAPFGVRRCWPWSRQLSARYRPSSHSARVRAGAPRRWIRHRR